MKIFYNIEIRKLMLESGMTQSDVANALGVSPQRISAIMAQDMNERQKQRFIDLLEPLAVKNRYEIERIR